ncbi:MAG: chromate transporter, partial [Pseudonocardiales bacterium]|nr:chromate transporter [Pseudonocardiales bacterium]
MTPPAFPHREPPDEPADEPADDLSTPTLLTVLRDWGRLGCVGFGGPPTHIKLLRDLCV